MTTKKISVIIPFQHETEQLRRCIRSLLPYRHLLEIILVSDKSDGKIEGIPILYTPACIGASSKRNAGVYVSTGEYLFFLDSDTILCKFDYEKVLNHLKSYDCITGITVPDEDDKNFLNWLLQHEYTLRFSPSVNHLVSTCATTCLIVSREAFDSIGGFDNEYDNPNIAVLEDFDFTLKLTKEKYTIFRVNSVQVYHYNVTTLKKYLHDQYHHAKGRVKFFSTHKKTTDEYTRPEMLLSSVFLLNIPYALQIVRKTGYYDAWLLVPLSILRSFTWVWGFIVGCIRR